MDFEQLCWQMRIVDGTAEYVKPRNVGILFFNDLPQNFIHLSQIEIVQFISTPGGDKMSEKIFQGPIHQQIKDALNYIKNVILKEHIRKVPDQAESIRFYNYPYISLKECIVNAIYHRSYEIRELVEIRIHPDKIEILIFPGPDRSIKQSDIDKGILVARRYRNRRIGEFLKELKLTEGRCTGIPKIRIAMKNNGSPEPVFETDDERSYFLTTLMIHPEARAREQVSLQESPQVIPQVTPQVTPQESPQVTPQLTPQLTPQESPQVTPQLTPQESPQVTPQITPQESPQLTPQLTLQVIQILVFCKMPRKKQEVLDFIGLSHDYKNYKRHILPLVKKGFLSMTHPENPRHRNQKYQTTRGDLKIMDKVTNKQHKKIMQRPK